MVKSYNEIGGLFLKTTSSRNGCTLGLSEKQKLTSRACADKEDALSGETDVMQIMSLPDELYDKEKSRLFFSLKENHKKPRLSGDALRLVVSRSTRMKELEGVVFGKALTPEERLSCYKINIKSQRDLAAAQQILRGVQGDAADKNISKLLTAGNLMLLVLRILMELSQNSGILLRYNVDTLSLLTHSSGEMQKQVASMQVAIDWLLSWRYAKTYPFRYPFNRGTLGFNPSLADVVAYTNESWAMSPEITANVCSAIRSPVEGPSCVKDMLTKGGYDDHTTIVGCQEHMAWIKNIDNSVSTEKEREQAKIRIRTTDKQVANSSVQYLLNITRGVKKDLAKF